MNRLTRLALVSVLAAGGMTAGVSAAQSAPTEAGTRYYSKTVRADFRDQCVEKAGRLVRKLQAQGYVVTFVGCAPDQRRGGFAGTVGWH